MSKKRTTLRPREARFLKNVANGMDYGDSYLAAGYQCKNKEVASACGSKLLRRLEEIMTDQEKVEVMVPTSEVVATGRELMLCAEDRIRLGATNMISEWKGMKTQKGEGVQGATIVIVQQLSEKDSDVIDVSKQKSIVIEPPKRMAITD